MGNGKLDQVQVDFWDCRDDAEILTHTTVDEAVQDWIEDWYLDLLSDIPKTVIVFGYRRQEFPIRADCLLENVLDHLDEECGPPDDGTEPTPGMVKAAGEFIEAMKREYVVWTCEQVVRIEYQVQEHPMHESWLEQEKRQREIGGGVRT